MLFKANIDSEVIKDKEKLAEQLYLFLNEFAYARLRYESKDNIEDCIQDTIMYMLDRFKEIENSPLNNVNIEKYFYNRANSHISYWLNNKVKERKKISKYAESRSYVEMMNNSYGIMPHDYIDYDTLAIIVNKYGLDRDKTDYLIKKSSEHLSDLGFIHDEYMVTDNHMQSLDGLVYAIVDEYLVKSVDDSNREVI